MTIKLDPTVQGLDDRVHLLQMWATEYNLTFNRRSQIGFGRPCVTMSYGDHAVGFGTSRSHEIMQNPMFFHDHDSPIGKERDTIYQIFGHTSPPDAYHKDDYMAVLAHGESDESYDLATNQMWEWVCKVQAECEKREVELHVVNELNRTPDLLVIVLQGSSQPYWHIVGGAMDEEDA